MSNEDGGQRRSEPLQVHRRGRQERLDAHVLQPATDGPGQPVPGLRLAVEALRAPAVAPVKAGVPLRPAFLAAAGAQQGGVVAADHHRFRVAARRQADRGQVATRALARLGMEEPAVGDRVARTQHLAARALGDVVLGVVAEPAQRHLAADRLFLGRDHRVDAAPLQAAVHLAVGVALVGGRHLHRRAGRRRDRVDLPQHVVALVGLAGSDLHVEHHADHVVDRRVLLVGGLEPAVARVGRHAGVRLGQADLLVFARLFAVPLGFPLARLDGLGLAVLGGGEPGFVLRQHGVGVPLAEARPGNVGADQRGVDVHHLVDDEADREQGRQ